VRLSLGMKPLQMEKIEDKERAAHAAKVAAKEEEQRKLKAEEVAERIQSYASLLIRLLVLRSALWPLEREDQTASWWQNNTIHSRSQPEPSVCVGAVGGEVWQGWKPTDAFVEGWWK